MVYCQAFGCRNTSSDKSSRGKSFHIFPNPEKRPEDFRKWVVVVKNPEKFLRSSYKWSKNDVICSDHFVKTDFEEDIRAKIMKTKPRIILKLEAVPSIISPNPLLQPLPRKIRPIKAKTNEIKTVHAESDNVMSAMMAEGSFDLDSVVDRDEATCLKPKTNSKATPKTKVKQTSGYRCMVGGCSNTFYDGFAVHFMAKKPEEGQPFTSIQTAWIDFIGRSRKFTAEDARTYKNITICAGHFEVKDYDKTQLQMYRLGIRKQRPILRKDAVPTVEIAKNPFPSDYLCKNGIAGLNKQSLSSDSSSTGNSATTVLKPTSLQQQQEGKMLMEVEDTLRSEKKKHKTGRQCVVCGFGNDSYRGFFMHRMPGKQPNGQERYNALQRAWISFIGRNRQFDTQIARTYKSGINLCSGHFRKEDYKSTDVTMFLKGLRTRPPALLKTAVPSIDIHVAKHPFPSVSTSSSSSPSPSPSPAQTIDQAKRRVDLASSMSTAQTEFHAICVEYVEDAEEEEGVPVERHEEDIPGEQAQVDKPSEDNTCEERERVDSTFNLSKGELHSVKVFPPNSQSGFTSETEWTSGSSVVLHLHADKPSEKTDKPAEITDKPAPTSKTPAGLRCGVGGCTNTWNQGFSIHEIPKKKGCIRDGWLEFIQNSRPDFNPNEKKRVYICSGHFDRSQYEPYQVRSYQYAIRLQPPRLRSDSVPHQKEAIQPFPVEWFIGEKVQAEVQKKRSLMSSSELYKVDDFVTTKVPATVGGGRDRRQSIYSRKQEVERILAMYDKKEKEKLQAEEDRILRAEKVKRLDAEAEEARRLRAAEMIRSKAEAEEKRKKAAHEKWLKAEEEKRVKVERKLKAAEEKRLKAELEKRLKAEKERKFKEEQELNLSEEERRIKAKREEEKRLKRELALQNVNIVNWGKWGEPDCYIIDGNQTNQSDEADAVYVMYVEEEGEEEESPSAIEEVIGEDEVHKVLLQEASHHATEGDRVAMFTNWEEFSSSETWIHDNRENQALSQDESNRDKTIDDDDCLKMCLNLLKGEAIPSLRPISQSTVESEKSCENPEAPYFERRDHEYHMKKQEWQWKEGSCSMKGCFNNSSTGFLLHEVPKKAKNIRWQWIQFIKASNPDFRILNRTIHLCCGHFERSQYMQSQLRSFQYGKRWLPPKLLSTAVPCLTKAVHPFPIEWFVDLNAERKRHLTSSSESNHDGVPARKVAKTVEGTDSHLIKEEVEWIQVKHENDNLEAAEATSIEHSNENSSQSTSSMVTPQSQHQTSVSGLQGNYISLTEDPSTVFIKEEVLSSDEEESVDLQGALSQVEPDRIKKEDADDISMTNEPSCSESDIGEDGEERSSLEEDENWMESIAVDDIVVESPGEALPILSINYFAQISPIATSDDSSRITPIETLGNSDETTTIAMLDNSARIPQIATIYESAQIASLATLDDSDHITPIEMLDSTETTTIAKLGDSAHIPQIARIDESAQFALDESALNTMFGDPSLTTPVAMFDD